MDSQFLDPCRLEFESGAFHCYSWGRLGDSRWLFHRAGPKLPIHRTNHHERHDGKRNIPAPIGAGRRAFQLSAVLQFDRRPPDSAPECRGWLGGLRVKGEMNELKPARLARSFGRFRVDCDSNQQFTRSRVDQIQNPHYNMAVFAALGILRVSSTEPEWPKRIAERVSLRPGFCKTYDRTANAGMADCCLPGTDKSF